MWDKLLGYFGDSLLRKFGEVPPDEWIEAIAELNDFQIRRGFKRLRHDWNGGAPSLPDFMRYCRAIGDSAPDEGPSERIPVPAIEGPKFDGWDITSNNRFLKYVGHRLTDTPRAWGFPGSAAQAEATRIAVGYKNAWAQDMREASELDAATGEIVLPPDEFQARMWNECMRRAEADITTYFAGKAA